MIEYKYYKELRDFAEKSGLPFDKETMRLYVKMVEKFTEAQGKEIVKLKMKNLEGRLQHGEIGVNRKEIKEHLRICKRVVNGIDEAMRMPVNFVRGSRIAKLMNELNNTIFMVGFSVKENSSIEGKADFEDELIKIFAAKQDDLLLKAAFDGTKRRNLTFSLDLENGSSGTVNYNKKESRFDFIEYSLHGYAKQIPL